MLVCELLGDRDNRLAFLGHQYFLGPSKLNLIQSMHKGILLAPTTTALREAL
jgi:hypothetical protein